MYSVRRHLTETDRELLRSMDADGWALTRFRLGSFFAVTAVALLLLSGLLLARPNGPSSNLRKAAGTATITVQLYASEDSAAVLQYAAVLFDGTTNAQIDSSFSGATNTVTFQNITTVGVAKNGSTLPTGYSLEQNYPNPFNPSTIIRFSVPVTDKVSLAVYDILGRRIATLVDQNLNAGSYQVTWSPNVASGVYFYRLQSGRFSETKKMIALDGSGHGAGGSRVVDLSAVAVGTAASSQTPLMKAQAGNYTLRIYSLAGVTSPQVLNRTVLIPSLMNDTTITLFQRRPGAHIYADNMQQVIEGFGGANVLIFGRPDMTPAEVQTAYGSGEGQIGMTIMRVSIPPDSTQFGAYVNSALLAKSLGAKIIATPWTPPAWMKTNSSNSGGSLDTSRYADYAAHLKSFADTMASHGASLYAVSVQNEPDANVGYQSCYWNATEFMNFMKYNAPSVGVPVFMPEALGYNHAFSDSTLNDSVACAHVAFIGGHIYGATPSPYPLAFNKGKETWMTEYLINSGGSTTTSIDTGWSGAIQTAKSINDCMTANMSAYVWWYTLRYYGPVDDGERGGVAGAVTKKGYVMSQYARFVRPGYRRVTADASPQSNVYVTAYRNGASTIIVALNLSPSPINQTFVIVNGTATSYAAYVTSSGKNCILDNVYDVSGGSFSVALDASSVTTFVSN